jgi:hypothetical protein
MFGMVGPIGTNVKKNVPPQFVRGVRDEQKTRSAHRIY